MQRRTGFLTGAFLLPLVVSCALSSPRDAAPTTDTSSSLSRRVRVFRADGGGELSLGQLWDELARQDVVFLGEIHTDETTHRFQALALEELHRLRPGDVTLAMEQFERDVQPVLDAYLAGEMTESEFLDSSRPWNNYATGYRPLVERARSEGIPVVASNTPRSLRRKISMGGADAWKGLSEEERESLPAELHPNSDSYWERFDRTVRGHGAAMGMTSAEARLYSAQSLWDNTMGDSVARVLDSNPRALVVHVNGGFHTAYREGTVEQLLHRRPDARVAAVAIRPTYDLASVEAADVEDRGDYVVFVESRATGLEGSTLSVEVPVALRYRLHVPDGAREGEPRPWLIWLPAEGARSEDALEYWKLALGEEAAVVVVEHIYPHEEEALYRSGRWFWEGDFFPDLGRVQGGVARLREYVLRYFPVAEDRLVLAGEGTGATVLVNAALRDGSLSSPVIACAPRRFQKLREGGLPEPREYETRLELLVEDGDAEWWRKELSEYDGPGLPSDLVVVASSAVRESCRRAVEEALGLEDDAPAEGEEERAARALVLTQDSPLAREWAALKALALRVRGEPVDVIPLSELGGWLQAGGTPGDLQALAFRGENSWSPALLEDSRALPLAPGPFGGTTVLVVPPGADEGERQAWQALVDEDVIKQRSRFASLEIVFEDEPDALATTLADLHERGRSNLLIVPAAFCASAETMRRLRDEAEPYADRFTINYLPGLGSRLHRLGE